MKKKYFRTFRSVLLIVLSIFAFFNLLIHITKGGSRDFLIALTNISAILLYVDVILALINRENLLNNFIFYLIDLVFIATLVLMKGTENFFQFYLLGRQSVLVIKHLFSQSTKTTSLINDLAKNPPIFLMLSFILTIFVGTLLLLLPQATNPQSGETSLLGALFTATSATCVTGLIVYDTGTHFTLFGQLIILLLIQIGGLGIMTISSALALIMGQKLSVRSESLIQNVVGESNKVDMIALVKNILLMTVFFEILGSLYLFFTFRGFHWDSSKSVYHAVFHSVSAFCNAGFSLYPDSLMEFKTNFNINFVITTLIILGGIGFPVINNIKNNFKRKFKFSRLTLHTKVVLITTLILIILGTVAFFFSEYNGLMNGYSLKDRIYASYFQSVTTRTAGFNTIDTARLSKASVFMSIILMFIGASPGSTGGGIKTTTFAIIVLSVLALISGNRDVNVFRKKIDEDTIKRVMALISISIFILSVLIFILLITEKFSFDQVIFEAFSAFGTVGLSMGITAKLTGIGKLIIIILMYMGRVGPLTLIFALSERNPKINYQYIEEKINIG
jgi:trk system potassium uptake protein TrkH